jgi:hypothetical protein
MEFAYKPPLGLITPAKIRFFGRSNTKKANEAPAGN